jgi:sulfate transport system substrate-binding protein
VILTRPGNPLGIHDFADLARPGVGVVHPDPLTSGGAQWALLAEYGSLLRSSGDSTLAEEQMRGIWRNVTSQAVSARAALTQFESGFGDALITYEQDLLGDERSGRLQGEIVYPPATILSEHTVVVIDSNVSAADRDLVDGFVDFLWDSEAQKIFTDYGFRSLDAEFNSGFHAIGKPFTVDDLGGWPSAKRDIVEGVWKSRILPSLSGGAG